MTIILKQEVHTNYIIFTVDMHLTGG